MLCFSNSQSDRRTGRRPIKVLTPPHLANAFLWSLRVIQQSWQLAVKWRVTGSEPDVFITAVCDHRAVAGAQTWQSITLSVWRSTEVKGFLTPDPQVPLDISIYSRAHDEGSADSWVGIKEQAAPHTTWELSFLNCVVKWRLLLWFHMVFKCLV